MNPFNTLLSITFVSSYSIENTFNKHFNIENLLENRFLQKKMLVKGIPLQILYLLCHFRLLLQILLPYMH